MGNDNPPREAFFGCDKCDAVETWTAVARHKGSAYCRSCAEPLYQLHPVAGFLCWLARWNRGAGVLPPGMEETLDEIIEHDLKSLPHYS